MNQIQATLENIQHQTRLIHKKTGNEVSAYYPPTYGTGKDQQTHDQITSRQVKDGVVGKRRMQTVLSNYWLKD